MLNQPLAALDTRLRPIQRFLVKSDRDAEDTAGGEDVARRAKRAPYDMPLIDLADDVGPCYKGLGSNRFERIGLGEEIALRWPCETTEADQRYPNGGPTVGFQSVGLWWPHVGSWIRAAKRLS